MIQMRGRVSFLKSSGWVISAEGGAGVDVHSWFTDLLKPDLRWCRKGKEERLDRY